LSPVTSDPHNTGRVFEVSLASECVPWPPGEQVACGEERASRLAIFIGNILASGRLFVVEPIARHYSLEPFAQRASFENEAILNDHLRGCIPSRPFLFKGVGGWPREELLEQVDLFGWHLIFGLENFLCFLVIDRGLRELTVDINNGLLAIEFLAHLFSEGVSQPVKRVRYLDFQLRQTRLHLWAGITLACFILQVIPLPYDFQILRVLAKGSPLIGVEVSKTPLVGDREHQGGVWITTVHDILHIGVDISWKVVI
jgi:hypothetical protein